MISAPSLPLILCVMSIGSVAAQDLIRVPAGKHKLVVRRDGVPEYSEDIEVRDQVISTITVDWGQ